MMKEEEILQEYFRWRRFANLLLLEAEKKHLVTKSDNDGAWSINLHRQSNENDEGIENYNEKHQEYLNKFEEIYVPVKDALKKGKSVEGIASVKKILDDEEELAEKAIEENVEEANISEDLKQARERVKSENFSPLEE